MFLTMEEAITAILETIKRSLGPITGDNGGCTFQTAAAEFGIQIASTIILFIVVAIFFWKPITNILEARRQVIDKELEDAKNAKDNAIEVELQLQKELKEAKEKVKLMLDTAVRDANLKRDEIISKAKQDAENRMKNLQDELAQEKKNMEDEIRKQIVEIAFEAAEKIVAKEIDQEKYLNVVDDILKGALE